jgi:hypothetical protein
MKKFLQGAILPFIIFSSGVLLLGCENNRSTDSSASSEQSSSEISIAQPEKQFKTGNMIYIVRDVADMQMKAGQYIEQLQQTKSNIETAVSNQNQSELLSSTQQLKTQLTNLNETLNSLDLKSQEVENIKVNILNANQKVLATPLLNGDVDLSKIDLKSMEKQMGNVQSEMLKLAAMLIPADDAKNN